MKNSIAYHILAVEEKVRCCLWLQCVSVCAHIACMAIVPPHSQAVGAMGPHGKMFLCYGCQRIRDACFEKKLSVDDFLGTYEFKHLSSVGVRNGAGDEFSVFASSELHIVTVFLLPCIVF